MSSDICEKIETFLEETSPEMDEGFFSKMINMVKMDLGKAIFNRTTLSSMKARIKKIEDPEKQRQAQQTFDELEKVSKELNVLLDQLLLLIENDDI